MRKHDLQNYMDGKRLWEEYMSQGKASSYTYLVRWCKLVGMVNPETGRVPSKSGVRFSMWRYAIRNPEEAYPAYKKFSAEWAHYPDFEEFCYDLYQHAICSKGIVVGKKEKRHFWDKYVSERYKDKPYREDQESKIFTPQSWTDSSEH